MLSMTTTRITASLSELSPTATVALAVPSYAGGPIYGTTCVGG